MVFAGTSSSTRVLYARLRRRIPARIRRRRLPCRAPASRRHSWDELPALRHPPGEPGRASSPSARSASPRSGGGGGLAGDRGSGPRPHRVDYGAPPHVDRRSAGPARRPHPRLRPPRQRPKEVLRLRGGGGFAADHVARLFFGEHPPAMEQHAAVGSFSPATSHCDPHLNAALRPPRRAKVPGAPAHPHHRLPNGGGFGASPTLSATRSRWPSCR